jgi:hypothetical protein
MDPLRNIMVQLGPLVERCEGKWLLVFFPREGERKCKEAFQASWPQTSRRGQQSLVDFLRLVAAAQPVVAWTVVTEAGFWKGPGNFRGLYLFASEADASAVSPPDGSADVFQLDRRTVPHLIDAYGWSGTWDHLQRPVRLQRG